ncbi:LOW QUALITY PROTEIN: hypothetical protein KUTeg_011875 [Tegillarca granosa]|uniref:Uncharacterized protein n=1 Tax=Tegillarca granosa TaxID=220873 RepID=A0ABQ9EXX7_TEGGR|nr:LOW QUALITY PROTEIN: hypothetical protein KUTeg_011875 [Tegillarca granosa]
MEDFASWQVDDLKSYLKFKGISSNLYRKRDLVRFCQKLHLENIDVESDYHDSYLARRTVDGNVLCDLGQIKVWDYNLRLLPNIEQYDVLIYLLHTCEWKEDRLKCYRKDNGHRLFTAGHLGMDDGTCKHCVALLFAVAEFCERHQDRHTLVGTIMECKWDKPRTRSEPVEVNDIDVRLEQKHLQLHSGTHVSSNIIGVETTVS